MVFSSGHSPYEIPKKVTPQLVLLVHLHSQVPEKTDGQGEKWALG